MSAIPTVKDRMPVQMRKPRAGPLLDPDEVIACALNGVPFKWWRDHPREPPLSASSIPVREIISALRMAGYKIEPL